MEVSIYIKCNFKGNPRGAGDATAIIVYIDKNSNKHTRVKQLHVKEETKNALSLKICISALRTLLKQCKVTIYFDCEYLKNIHHQGWVKKWQQDGWKRANNKPPANVAEWKQFFMLSEIHKIAFKPYDGRYEKDIQDQERKVDYE